MPGPVDPMHLDGEADDLLGQFARKQHTVLSPCCFVVLRDLRVKSLTFRNGEPRDDAIIPATRPKVALVERRGRRINDAEH